MPDVVLSNGVASFLLRFTGVKTAREDLLSAVASIFPGFLKSLDTGTIVASELVEETMPSASSSVTRLIGQSTEAPRSSCFIVADDSSLVCKVAVCWVGPRDGRMTIFLPGT